MELEVQTRKMSWKTCHSWKVALVKVERLEQIGVQVTHMWL